MERPIKKVPDSISKFSHLKQKLTQNQYLDLLKKFKEPMKRTVKKSFDGPLNLPVSQVIQYKINTYLMRTLRDRPTIDNIFFIATYQLNCQNFLKFESCINSYILPNLSNQEYNTRFLELLKSSIYERALNKNTHFNSITVKLLQILVNYYPNPETKAYAAFIHTMIGLDFLANDTISKNVTQDKPGFKFIHLVRASANLLNPDSVDAFEKIFHKYLIPNTNNGSNIQELNYQDPSYEEVRSFLKERIRDQMKYLSDSNSDYILRLLKLFEKIVYLPSDKLFVAGVYRALNNLSLSDDIKKDLIKKNYHLETFCHSRNQIVQISSELLALDDLEEFQRFVRANILTPDLKLKFTPTTLERIKKQLFELIIHKVIENRTKVTGNTNNQLLELLNLCEQLVPNESYGDNLVIARKYYELQDFANTERLISYLDSQKDKNASSEINQLKLDLACKYLYNNNLNKVESLIKNIPSSYVANAIVQSKLEIIHSSLLKQYIKNRLFTKAENLITVIQNELLRNNTFKAEIEFVFSTVSTFLAEEKIELSNLQFAQKVIQNLRKKYHIFKDSEIEIIQSMHSKIDELLKPIEAAINGDFTLLNSLRGVDKVKMERNEFANLFEGL